MQIAKESHIQNTGTARHTDIPRKSETLEQWQKHNLKELQFEQQPLRSPSDYITLILPQRSEGEREIHRLGPL